MSVMVEKIDKYVTKVVKISLLIFFVGIILYYFLFVESGNKNEVKLADGFKIQSYDVTLDVKEDNKVEVTEDINVHFTKNYKHGILKFIPLWLEYTDKNGKTIKRKAKILNLRAEGEPYSVDKVKGKDRIKIGNPNEYVKEVDKKYKIKYTYDMGKDPFLGFDQFIFHAYGDYWGTEIKNATLNINMPKKFNSEDVNFYMDKYKKQEANNFVDYTINENSIKASFNQEKYNKYIEDDYCKDKNDGKPCVIPSYRKKVLDHSLTVDINLPNGYFVGGSFNYGLFSFIFSIAIFIITLFNFMTWKKYGKNYKKVPREIQFYPPDNYNAAEIGYIYAKSTNKRLTIALIVQLASKGYIKIDDVKDSKDDVKITNLLTLSNGVSYDNKYTKLETLTNTERIVYDNLFKTEDEVILSKHLTFYKTFQAVDNELNLKLKNLIDDNKASSKMIKSIFITIIVTILSIVSFKYIKDMDPKLTILYYLSFACIGLNLFFTIIMKRKTKYGEEITSKVKGFREFLINVEKDKLETLVQDDPKYFYNILPYTYVLDVSKKWIEKFENINYEKMDIGSYNLNDNDLYRMYSNIYYPTSVSSGSGTSGCSSCGGGCSSCGGGCSSCGGGGSW